MSCKPCLPDSAVKTPNIWDLCPALLKANFIKYFKSFAKRLGSMDPHFRILPVNEEEKVGTTVSVPGFVLEYNKKKPMNEQKWKISNLSYNSYTITMTSI